MGVYVILFNKTIYIVSLHGSRAHWLLPNGEFRAKKERREYYGVWEYMRNREIVGSRLFYYNQNTDMRLKSVLCDIYTEKNQLSTVVFYNSK